MQRIRIRTGILTALLLVGAVQAQVPRTVLYDGSGNQSPVLDGWALLVNPPIFSSVTESTGNGAVILDTTAVTGEQAGYFSTGLDNPPVLDRHQGFTLRWSVQVNAETHLSINRAGFSVLAVCSDLEALEIGFWADEVWAQHDSPLFTHGEGVPFVTTTATNDYALLVHGTNYAVRVNGAPLLSGPLRNYEAFTGTIDPYETPNLIFLGDDTSSAEARFTLSRISFTTWPDPPAISNLVHAAGSTALELGGLAAGFPYAIERSGLSVTNFVPVAGMDFIATGTTTSRVDAAAPPAGAVYRLRAEVE